MNHLGRRLLLVVLVLNFLSASPIGAQDNGPTAPPAALSTALNGENNGTDSRLLLLQQIKSLQEKLESGLDQQGKGSSEVAKQTASGPDQDTATAPATAAASSVDQDLAKLKKRLEMMKLLLNGPPAAAVTPPPIAPEPSPPANTQIPIPDTTTTPPVVPMESAAVPQTPAGADQSTKLAGTPGIPLIAGPVDLFELANNIFAVGEAEYAMKIYESPELQLTDPNDLNWRDYYLACCYRSVGKLKEAEAIYRQIVADNKTSALGQASEWWLAHLAIKDGLKGAMDNLDYQLEHYRAIRAGKEK